MARLLGKLGLFEKLAATIPKLILHTEHSTDLQE
jgi:hypothetical protein